MIAAVTNYYNPARRPAKAGNYERFRSELRGIDLYVVEAAFGDDPFTLPDDGRLLRVRCRDFIWQQYRLVNLVVRNLPDVYDKVVWIDADIIFRDPGWAVAMSDMLDDHEAVQSYATADMLGPDGSVVETKVGVVRNAAVNKWNPGRANYVDMSANLATGFSWGVRRELVEKHGVYDYWVTGSSDNAFVIGLWGDWDNPFLHERLNPAMKRHFTDWAVPFHDYVHGRFGYLDTTVGHLWHGRRNYKKRWNCLRDFDPYTDIAVVDGVFEWRNDKQHLKDCCRSMCLNYDVEFRESL